MPSTKSGSPSVAPGLATLTLPGNLLERQILRLNSRLEESETLEVGTGNLCLNSPQGDLMSAKI